MDPTDPGQAGQQWVADYDELHRHLDPADTVDAVAELAGGGPVLELGVGTGRIALPLAARGVEVVGVDASAAMLQRLHDKPGGQALATVEADFVDVTLDRRFAVVLAAFNTLFAVTSQPRQVAAVANAAAHLQPGGMFAVEAFVPDLEQFHRGQSVRASQAGGDDVVLKTATHDPANQRIDSTVVWLSPRGIRTHPVTLRYAWPGELDLMAQLAGLELVDRWGGWDRRPFTSASGTHVSIYQHRGATPPHPPAGQ